MIAAFASPDIADIRAACEACAAAGEPVPEEAMTVVLTADTPGEFQEEAARILMSYDAPLGSGGGMYPPASGEQYVAVRLVDALWDLGCGMEARIPYLDDDLPLQEWASRRAAEAMGRKPWAMRLLAALGEAAERDRQRRAFAALSEEEQQAITKAMEDEYFRQLDFQPDDCDGGSYISDDDDEDEP